MSGKPATTLAFEKRWNPALSLGQNEFIESVSEGIPQKPAETAAILRANKGLA